MKRRARASLNRRKPSGEKKKPPTLEEEPPIQPSSPADNYSSPSSIAPTLKTVTILCDRYAIDYVFPSYQNCAWWDQLRDAGVNLQADDAEAYEEWY
ncbi:hypothetical protein FIBSPDRAFT_874129 [Athelia psychrophila]|uniref:Uncharacterized protein n=1 Tax=Athelia psychrophila TaxID=1759441 RepID=A0A165XT52_9AGAM|nr:hypothetical protein FIBSPDRAFT_874129 [Fibularhizoctonia sp. CBS 109695]